MGTRADFYVGRGESAEWIGSIAMDGNPRFLLRYGVFAASIEQYRQAVADLIRGKDHGTSTAQGWPWPWDNSCETEYAYAFDCGKVYGTAHPQVYDAWRRHWFDALAVATLQQSEDQPADDKAVVFPNMSACQSVAYGMRSGLLIPLGAGAPAC